MSCQSYKEWHMHFMREDVLRKLHMPRSDCANAQSAQVMCSSLFINPQYLVIKRMTHALNCKRSDLGMHISQ